MLLCAGYALAKRDSELSIWAARDVLRTDREFDLILLRPEPARLVEVAAVIGQGNDDRPSDSAISIDRSTRDREKLLTVQLMTRIAAASELAEIAGLWSTNAGPTMLAGGLADAQRLFARDDAAVIVAVRSGVLVGTVVVGWDGWRCHLYRMAVAANERRAGVGAALFDAAVQRATSLGATRIDAMVDVENSGAVAFWESVGFELDLDDRRWSLLLPASGTPSVARGGRPPRVVERADENVRDWGDHCKAWALASAPGLAVVAEMMPPGTREGPHFHERATQFFYVIRGRLTIVVDGEAVVVCADQGVTVPAGCAHEVHNDADEPAHFLAVAGPNNAGDRVDIVDEAPDSADASR